MSQTKEELEQTIKAAQAKLQRLQEENETDKVQQYAIRVQENKADFEDAQRLPQITFEDMCRLRHELNRINNHCSCLQSVPSGDYGAWLPGEKQASDANKMVRLGVNELLNQIELKEELMLGTSE